jgi:hypothetical protein
MLALAVVQGRGSLRDHDVLIVERTTTIMHCLTQIRQFISFAAGTVEQAVRFLLVDETLS